jgi:uncharacterized protein
MAQRTSYAQGTPNWVDLQTTDPDAAKAFYSGLFDEVPMGESATYSIAQLDGDSVAAIGPQDPQAAQAGAPPMWNTYIAVDSVDDTVAKVAAAGGQVLMEPADVMDAGRMALVLDPAGVAVAAWQAKDHIGASRVNEHGTLAWNELITADPAASTGFYNQVFGLTTSETEMGEGNKYLVFEVGGQQVGGATAPYAEGTPNHWHVYFGTSDADAAAAKAAELGGTVVVPPFDTPVGRMGVLQDPQGATFSIFQV